MPSLPEPVAVPDRVTEFVDIRQVDALDVSTASTNPLADETDGSFVVRSLPSVGGTAGQGVTELQNLLDARGRTVLVHELHDAYLQSTHWMVSVGGDLIRQTRYLIHDMYLARNFKMIQRAEAWNLDDQRIWILGANYAPGNYWHWHAQSLPAIVHAMETIPIADRHQISVLTGVLAPWQRDGLRALGLASDQLVEMAAGKTLHAPRLIYSDLLSSRQAFGQNRARSRTALALQEAARGVAEHPGGASKRRLYISRRDSVRRPLLNESELWDGLARLGFARVSNSELGLLEQVRMYESADMVVAPHGAGSTNMLFMRPGSSFVELQQESHVNAGPLSLGKTSGLVPYADVFEDDGLGQATKGWHVDVERVLALVDAATGD